MPFLLCVTALSVALMSSGPTGPPQKHSAEARTADLARRIARKLQSTNPATVAWGAYEAGAYHLSETIPALQWILELPPSADDRQRRALLDVVLDALVQLRARLPASLLIQHIDERPVQTLALLVNANDREPVLRRLLAQTSGLPWYAATNILLRDKAQALAAHLHQTLHLRLIIRVRDSEHVDSVGSGESSGGVGMGHGIGQRSPGYPPHAQYRFELVPRRGLVVLATGPRPVFYSRTLSRTSQYAVSDLRLGGPTDDERIAYMRAMMGSTGPPAVHAETNEWVRWINADALVRRVRELRAEVQRRYNTRIEDSLRRAYRLSANSATAQPRVEVRLIDERIDRSVPLPRLTY